MRRLLLFVVAAATVAVGCGSDSDSGSATNVTAAAAAGAAPNRDDAMKGEGAKRSGSAMKRPGTTLKIVDSEFGSVVANGKGEALYLFDKERRPQSRCYGACARAWPPVLTKGRPRAGSGADASLIGTTKRRDGKLQVTYAGQPLYFYVGDSPGTILCHDVDEFGGTWLVVQPDGSPAP